uniref:Glycoside hydrolase family protein n=1 Tax=Mycena chlorophos TaxID=658473 RepID=A0ABQ0KU71_MYCCL|nr:glycoside hydrolase family protein [Mycena chlorophos]
MVQNNPTPQQLGQARKAAGAGAVASASLVALALAIAGLKPDEGYRSKTYLDVANIPTYCWGHADRSSKVGTYHSPAECEAIFSKDVNAKLEAVKKCTPILANMPNQLAASTRLTFNIGEGNYCHSTIAKNFNAGKFKEASAKKRSAWKDCKMGELTILEWLAKKLSPIVLPLTAGLLLLNIASGAALFITRHTLADARKEQAAEIKSHAADKASWEAATAQAEADDLKRNLLQQQAQEKISQEKQNDLEKQLASARALAANWLRTHGAPAADFSGGKNTGVPGSPDTPAKADAAAGYAIISASDLDACAVAYTVAKGWQDWWVQEQAVMLQGSMPTVGAIIPAPSMRASLGTADGQGISQLSSAFPSFGSSNRSMAGKIITERQAFLPLGSREADMFGPVVRTAFIDTQLPFHKSLDSTTGVTNQVAARGSDNPPNGEKNDVHRNFLP